MAILFIGFKSHRELERRGKKHLEGLELQLTQKWNNIELSALEKLVDSVDSRLDECVKMKGSLSKY